MAETKKLLHIYRLDYHCDELDCDGLMEPTGECLPTATPQYMHKCNKCGVRRRFWKAYPKLVYKEVNNE